MLKTKWTSGGVEQTPVTTTRQPGQSVTAFLAVHRAAVEAAVAAAPIDANTTITTTYTKVGAKIVITHHVSEFGANTLSVHLAAVDSAVIALE